MRMRVKVQHDDHYMVKLHNDYGPLRSSCSVQRGACVYYGSACVMECTNARGDW